MEIPPEVLTFSTVPLTRLCGIQRHHVADGGRF